MVQSASMVLAFNYNRPKGQQALRRRVTFSAAVATLAIQLVLPDMALAQTDQAIATAPCAVSFPDHSVSLALGTATRAEPGAGPVDSTKARAILGGKSSKLDQMRSIQAPSPLAAAGINGTMTPSSSAQSSNCAHPTGNFSTPDGATSTVFKTAILGAQSVAVSQTPFDSDWAGSRTGLNNIRIQHALTKSGARGAADKGQQVQMVNRWVNQNIAFGDDKAVYQRADYWAPTSETLRRGIGDCEDFAIAKMDMLAALGVTRADMRLVIARDLARNADHAVLVVELHGRSVMLDNVTDRLLDGRTPNDYRPIMSFSQNAKWVHGYGVQQPATVRLASLPAAVAPASGQASDVIAVTSEPELPVISIAWLSAPLVLPTLL